MKITGRSRRPLTRPTRSGYSLMLVLLAMLTASTNYGNNMAYIITFLIFSLLLVSLVYTRRNLKGIIIENIKPQPAFAGEQVKFSLEVKNPLSGGRYGIYLAGPQARSAAELFGPFTVDPFSSASAEITLPAHKRGRFTLSQVIVLTVYPLGLFRVLYPVTVAKTYLVYPQPLGILPWPLANIEGDGYIGSSARGGDDFVGTRPYRPGESQHHIDWKVVARGGPLSIKEFTGGGVKELWFNWDQLSGLGTETRLSQLTRWVLEADEQGVEFGLKLLDSQIDVGSGSAHTLKCLNSLALFEYHVEE